MEQQGLFINEDTINQLLKILNDNSREKQAAEFTGIITYVDTLEKQLGSVMNELQNVKSQLEDVQAVQSKTFKDVLTDKVNRLEHNVKQMQTQISAIKEKIVQTATSIVNDFKEKGIYALDHMTEFMGIKKFLTALHENINKNIQAVNLTIYKVNSVTQEINAVVKHSKNVARLMTGNGRKHDVATPSENLVKPLKVVKNVLLEMENSTKNSIDKLNHLSTRATEAEKKPSILQSLKTYKENSETHKEVPKMAKGNESVL